MLFGGSAIFRRARDTIILSTVSFGATLRSNISRQTRAGFYRPFFTLYASPQFHMASKIGLRLQPKSVNVYSTRGGTSG